MKVISELLFKAGTRQEHTTYNYLHMLLLFKVSQWINDMLGLAIFHPFKKHTVLQYNTNITDIYAVKIPI